MLQINKPTTHLFLLDAYMFVGMYIAFSSYKFTCLRNFFVDLCGDLAKYMMVNTPNIFV